MRRQVGNVDNRALAKKNKQVFREAEEKPTTAATVPLCVDAKYHQKFRKIFSRHEFRWLGKLGDVNVTIHPIDLIPITRPFQPAPYRAGPKTREMERSDIQKQLDAELI